MLGQDSNGLFFWAENLQFGPTLDEKHATSLTRDVSEQEIKDALFSIGDDKSPVPDGFTSCFFKEAWDIVGNDFMEAIHEFFALDLSLSKRTIPLLP